MRKRIYEIVEVAGKNDKISHIYDSFMTVLIIVSIVPVCFKTSTPFLHFLDLLTVSAFIIDYALRWITADYKIKSHQGLATFVCYPFTPFAIIDLLSILPSISILNKAFKLFRLLRLVKAFRVLRILRYSKSFSIIISVIRKEKTPLLSVCYMALGYILVSALIMFSVEPDSFSSFYEAIYWATTALTTVGYGDIYPVSNIGRFVSMISSFMGIAIVALPTGIITAGYTDALHELKKETAGN